MATPIDGQAVLINESSKTWFDLCTLIGNGKILFPLQIARLHSQQKSMKN